MSREEIQKLQQLIESIDIVEESNTEDIFKVSNKLDEALFLYHQKMLSIR
ncbi:hypothetical protein [Natronincola ferrireducens]|nr:hypothetical protein [Natronincola ferrireducens]